jgi:hypothetical protein
MGIRHLENPGNISLRAHLQDQHRQGQQNCLRSKKWPGRQAPEHRKSQHERRQLQTNRCNDDPEALD